MCESARAISTNAAAKLPLNDHWRMEKIRSIAVAVILVVAGPAGAAFALGIPTEPKCQRAGDDDPRIECNDWQSRPAESYVQKAPPRLARTQNTRVVNKRRKGAEVRPHCPGIRFTDGMHHEEPGVGQTNLAPFPPVPS
jgi:hypothetical protein